MTDQLQQAAIKLASLSHSDEKVDPDLQSSPRDQVTIIESESKEAAVDRMDNQSLNGTV